MRVALLRVAVLSVGSMMCAIFCHAQTSTFTSVPQLFYEDTTASQRVITQLAVDNAGNVVSFTVQTGLDCGFGICGAVVYSIAPDGSLNWVTPAPNYVAHAVNQIAIASDNSIFFQDQFATQEVMGLTPTGSIAPGWPVALGSDLDTANSTLLIDPIDQSIFAKGGAASAFEPPLTRTASFRQDGTTKWVADFPTGAFNTPGMILGPNANVYTFTDRTVLLDRSDGHTICAFPVLGGDSFSPITGGDGLVFSYTATQVLRSDSGCIPFSIYNWDTNRHGFLLSYDHGILFAEDLPNNGVPGTPRFIAFSKDGVLLWANDLINPLSVAAVNHGLVYVVGIDTNAICCSQQKLFVLDGSNGNILTSLDITAVCPACVKVAVGSSGAYVADLSSTRIYKVNEIRPVWPMTGHDAQRTGRSTFVGPTNAPISPSWIFKSGGPIIGDIVISADGTIYFTSDKLYALNPNGTDYAPAVAITPITSPAIDDVNGFIYVIANSSGGGYDVLRYSKRLQDATIVYHGSFKFVTPTSMIIGPDGTLYFSDGVSIIAVGAKNWETPFDPCFGNPAFLTPALGRDGSVYSMCEPGGGAGMGSGIYRFDANTGSQIGFAPYSRGGTELLIDDQNEIRAGFQAFDGITFGGSYDRWDINLNQLTITNPFDPTTSRSALMPDGTSTVRIGFSFQTNELDATGAHVWGVPSGPQTLPNFSTVPTIDATGNVFVGTISGVAALSGIDGSTVWFQSLADTITTQPIISAGGALVVGSSSGKVYAFESKPATGTLVVSTNNAAATFTITGPATYSGNGTSFTQTNAPAGVYTIQYQPIAGYSTPPNETQTLMSGATLLFRATYSLLPTPKLTVSPGTLAFSAIDGFLDHIPAQSVSISTDTGSPVDVSISVSTTSGGQWLSVGGSSGTTPGILTMRVSILPLGKYSGTIRVTSSSVSNSPIDIPVTFTVTPLVPYTVLPTVYPTGVTPEAESTIARARNQLAAAITDVSAGRFLTQLATSIDSGNSWTHGLIPSGTADNLDWSNVADPVVAMGRDGAIYVAEVHLKGSASGLYVAAGTSADPPIRREQIHRVTANTSSFASTCEDKPWITVDNSGSSFDGTIYAVWDRFFVPSHTGCEHVNNLTRKVLAALFWGSPNGSRIMISVSHDHGISWSQPKSIGGGPGTTVFGPQVSVAPNGMVYVVYQIGAGGTNVGYAITSSTDGGNSFTDSFIATPSIIPPNFSFIDNRLSSPAMAISPLTGEIAIAFADQAADGTTRIKVVTSTDGGQSFGDPVTANDTQAGNRFRPALAYDDFGILHIAWIDTRNAIDNRSFDIYGSYAPDGGTEFAPNARITLTTIKGSAGDFVGDYNGGAAVQGSAWFSWAAGSVDRNKNTGNGQLAVGQAIVFGISR